MGSTGEFAHARDEGFFISIITIFFFSSSERNGLVFPILRKTHFSVSL